ncbi:Sorting assembly machinery 35 kDa subunit [Spathaspora sp. JA1]|nr:Sorting assembly machinery 35 kDa subunit [Spathaspora sp. JA1]
MLKVPQVIKTFFDSVPINTIDDQSNTQLDDINIDYFQGNNSCTSSSKFTLAVFNSMIEQDLILPTDPISLGYALLLSHKSKFTLPSSANKNSNEVKSNCGIVAMSHLGSPNNVLPIIIEDIDNIRTIKNLDTINHEFTDKNFGDDQEAKLINQLIDIKFYDIWLQCILTEELPYKILSELFGLDISIEDNFVLQKSQMYEFLNQVPNWNSFKLRHPTLLDSGVWNTSHYLKNYYTIQISEFDQDFKLIIDYLNKHPNSLLRYKVAGYVISIDKFLKSTKLGEVVLNQPDFLVQCYELLA